MPLPTVMYYFGFVHLTLDYLRARGYQAPFRISSTPKGSVMPTALYVLIEDIVAVDGGGGKKYRRALRDRYLASPYFRQMLFEMNCFWGGGSIICAVIITVVIFTTSRDVAYTVGCECRCCITIYKTYANIMFVLAWMDTPIYMGRHLDCNYDPLGSGGFTPREGCMGKEFYTRGTIYGRYHGTYSIDSFCINIWSSYFIVAVPETGPIGQ